jgi:AmiR/NasT family two-component response regulator
MASAISHTRGPVSTDGSAGRLLTAEELAIEVEHLRRALASRDVIGQAKGILMERFRVPGEEAFGLLVNASQRRNVKVSDLATELAQTGEWLGPFPEAE